ncbi:CxxxxCH/CxxCH domain-containing protein [Bacteroidota bacterium]
MKYIKYSALILHLLLMVFIACSNLKDDIISPQKVGIHGEEIFNINSSNFHGSFLINDSLQSCKNCHASDFSGGTAIVGCNSPNCHPAIGVHQNGILTTTSANFHGKFLKNTNWNLSDCKQCHGSDYTGKISSPSCSNSGCHSSSDGPETCNTCHGDFNNDTLIAPPQALNDSTVTTDKSVGAHTEHLNANILSVAIPCNECHQIPQQFDSQTHIDNTAGADIIFGNLATSYEITPLYDRNNFTCTNSYCHGNFELLKDSSQYTFVYASGADKIEGNNFNPVWNVVDGTQAACGTCHNIPPTGHAASSLTGCDNCHPGVVDNNANIIDKTKHINGVVNVFGN